MSLRTMTWNGSVLAIAIGMAIWSTCEVAIMVRQGTLDDIQFLFRVYAVCT